MSSWEDFFGGKYFGAAVHRHWPCLQFPNIIVVVHNITWQPRVYNLTFCPYPHGAMVFSEPTSGHISNPRVPNESWGYNLSTPFASHRLSGLVNGHNALSKLSTGNKKGQKLGSPYLWFKKNIQKSGKFWQVVHTWCAQWSMRIASTISLAGTTTWATKSAALTAGSTASATPSVVRQLPSMLFRQKSIPSKQKQQVR